MNLASEEKSADRNADLVINEAADLTRAEEADAINVTTATSAEITWDTNVDANGEIRSGETNAYGKTTAQTPARVIEDCRRRLRLYDAATREENR